MATQRMAGGNEFQSKMQQAAKGPGGQEHKTKPASLFGADAYDRQVQRESQSFNNAAISGSRNAENIQAYANASKQATAANGNFSVDTGNKWSNAGREQKKINKEDQKGFSDNRITNNVNYANSQRGNNIKNNEGFAMGITNDYINNAKEHREDNTRKAADFATRTVNKYINMNKGIQPTNVAALDQQVRKAPIVDKAKSEVQGLKTYGDMYRYGREGLPTFNMPNPMKEVEKPDLDKIGDKYSDKIEDMKI